MMNPLGPPDCHHLAAAQGWLELGDERSAEAELAGISVGGQMHPDTLAMRWELLARRRDWKSAHAVAQTALDLAPERPGPWIQRSYALHELKLTQEAYESLCPAVEVFPDETTIAYNLACYCCQLERRDEALSWYERALSTGDAPRIKQMALRDPDLAPLREQIARR